MMGHRHVGNHFGRDRVDSSDENQDPAAETQKVFAGSMQPESSGASPAKSEKEWIR